MQQALPIHPTLTHPVTGEPLRAVFVSRAGRVYWPILGGSEGGAGGEGGSGDGGDGGAGAGAPPAEYTPPATQQDLDRIIETRLARERGKFADYDHHKERSEQYAALELELATDTERATLQASQDGYNAAMQASVPRIVLAEFRAEAKGLLTQEQLDALVEDVDLTRFAFDDGEPDVEKIRAKVAAIAPRGADGRPVPFMEGRRATSLGQGNHQQSRESARDKGRAEAQRRFGPKADAPA